jgi:hypothetical protein
MKDSGPMGSNSTINCALVLAAQIKFLNLGQRDATSHYITLMLNSQCEVTSKDPFISIPGLRYTISQLPFIDRLAGCAPTGSRGRIEHFRDTVTQYVEVHVTDKKDL